MTWRFVVPPLLAVAAFVSILNNGFIADDFVTLSRLDNLKANPFYLYSVPPENFRTTLYIAFAILKTLFGYNAPGFYVFDILLHAANALLLGYFLLLLKGDSGIAFWASCFFAVFSAPQEAVMWIAGMTESLLVFFSLMTLILWLKDRPVLAALAYAGASLSKESSVIVLLLVPLMELYRGQRPFRRAYLLLLIPAGLFGLTFIATAKANGMIANGIYKVGGQAFGALARTLFRLSWPWFYIVLVVRGLASRSWPRVGTIALSLAGVFLFLLPYMFIAYAPSLPSRNVYMASAALMAVFSILLGPIHRTRLFQVFAVVFIIFNIGYLWIRKDRQFEERAAPTTALLRALEGHKPQKTLIIDFAYPYPEIARASVRLLPGWTPDQIVVGKSRDACPECRQLKWNSRLQLYEETP